MKKVQIPSGEPVGRIVCDQCDNSKEFVEISENVEITKYYAQNSDGSFTVEANATKMLGEVRFLCGQCGADLSRFHGHFQEMSF